MYTFKLNVYSDVDAPAFSQGGRAHPEVADGRDGQVPRVARQLPKQMSLVLEVARLHQILHFFRGQHKLLSSGVQNGLHVAPALALGGDA